MRIVTLGGGTGQGQLLKGLAKGRVDLTGIVGVTDNGGHSGHLREMFSIPAVGDLRNCMLALAPDTAWTRALKFRFAAGDLDGASAGNLLLSALTLSEGSVSKAAAVLSAQLGLKARILPVSDGASQICAVLEDGRTIKGEWDFIQRTPRTPIVKLFHDPPLTARPECLTAIRRADLVVIAPGALRSSLISILLATGMKEALRKVRVAMVLNILTQAGQTDGFTARDHVAEVATYLGREPEVVIANTKRPPAWAIGKDAFVEPDIDAVKADLLHPVTANDPAAHRPKRYVSGPHLVRHDPARLARVVLKVARSR